MINSKNISVVLLATASLLIFSACNDDDDPKVIAPDAPAVNNASEITASGFKVTWAEVDEADVYLLDVSLEADFDPTITGYAKKEIDGTSHVLTALEDGTKYYFRVYAKEGSRISAASTVKDATTLVAP
jgi:hypothetical protein